MIEAVGKFTSLGLVSGCITKHEDFNAVANRTVLLEVGPLLKDKTGKLYKKQGLSENKYV